MVKRMCHSIFLMFLCLIAFVGATYAWFASQKEMTEDRLWAMTLAKYFYSGTGTEADPYVITTPRHLYNLSWLQNKNYFSDDAGNPKSCYFTIGNSDHPVTEIDMAGAFPDLEGRGGAIPPIGSIDNPFIGYFDGNGAVIKNLWISTDSVDWHEDPGQGNYNEVNYKDGVGLFGYIKRPEGDTTPKIYAGNFVLENVEITSHYSNAIIGIAAGYVDAAMSKIGVNNAIITLKGNDTIASDHTLIGRTSTEAVWKDLPGSGGGGDLVVAPSGLKDTTGDTMITYDRFSTISSGEREIPNASKLPNGRASAYYRGTLTLTTPKPQPSAASVYMYNGASPTFGAGVKTTNANTSNSKTLSSYSATNEDFRKLMQAFQNYLNASNRLNSQFTGIEMTNLPNVTAANINGPTKYPSNCIWFKPQNTGHCLIAFGVTNMSSDAYVSIYRYKRNASGVATDIQELQLVFSASGNKFKNGDIIVVDLNLSNSTDKDYEYVIGKSTTGNNQAYFFFLKLAGVDKNSGDAADGNISLLEKIEFVQDGFITSNFDLAGYTPGKSDLQITGTANNVTIRFDEKNDGLVHYTKPAGITITEKVTNGESRNDETGPYDPRKETAD